jgi:hypothetical protein
MVEWREARGGSWVGEARAQERNDAIELLLAQVDAVTPAKSDAGRHERLTIVRSEQRLQIGSSPDAVV